LWVTPNQIRITCGDHAGAWACAENTEASTAQGAPNQPNLDGRAPSPAYVNEFLSTADGIALIKAFMRLPNAKLRRSIVAVVEEIADRQ
jgi:hypothetical protein